MSGRVLTTPPAATAFFYLTAVASSLRGSKYLLHIALPWSSRFNRITCVTFLSYWAYATLFYNVVNLLNLC
jgi:hypothetical protein